jgi:translation initiation factor 2B subunit (eIF-2B alpha/beta/delta family)
MRNEDMGKGALNKALTEANRIIDRLIDEAEDKDDRIRELMSALEMTKIWIVTADVERAVKHALAKAKAAGYEL